MKVRALGLAALAGCVAIAARAQQEPAQQGDRWSWHGRIAAGKTVDIRNINGSVSADLASGAEVEVTAVKHAGRRGNPEDVRIQAVESDGDVRVCVIYPGRNYSDACAQRGQRSRRHDDDDDENRNDTEVQFTVHVPRGVSFVGATVNGDVDARALQGPVEARSVNGGVDIETTSGEASGTSVNGPVRAIVRGQGTEPLHFQSVNGQVDVTLPRNLDADVEAATVNGSITTDFEITIQGGMMMHRSRLHGRIGRGGRTLRVETVNGSIHLRAAS